MSELTYESWFPTHTPWGTRTYLDVPVSEHPATARLRAHVAALQAALDDQRRSRSTPSSNIADAIAHAQHEIRRFEDVEYEARAQRWMRALDLDIR